MIMYIQVLKQIFRNIWMRVLTHILRKDMWNWILMMSIGKKEINLISSLFLVEVMHSLKQESLNSMELIGINEFRNSIDKRVDCCLNHLLFMARFNK